MSISFALSSQFSSFLMSASPIFFKLLLFGPAIGYNVSICVRAGLPKPRPVPDTERIKDTKTLDYASTPLDANTLLVAGVCPECLPRVQFSDSFIEW